MKQIQLHYPLSRHKILYPTVLLSYEETQKNLKDQLNSQLDNLLNLFDSLLDNVSRKTSLTGDSRSSDILLTETATKQSVGDLMNAECVIKPIFHIQIEEVFKELHTEYEKWYADIYVKMASFMLEIDQLKVFMLN